MANIVHSTVVFEGPKEKLVEIQNLIITKNRGRDTLDYSFIQNNLPGIEDQLVYKLVGCDYNDLVLHKYSKEEEKAWDKKVVSFIKSQGWIGLRDAYINDSVNHVKTSFESETKLVLECDFNWYSPDSFFLAVSEKFNVNVKSIVNIEGNYTYITLKNNKNNLISIKNTANSIINNNLFIDTSISIGLHRAEDIALVAIISGKDELASRLINHFYITEEQINNSIEEIYNTLDEDYYDIFQENTFIGFNEKKIKSIDKEEVIQKFNLLVKKLNNFKI